MKWKIYQKDRLIYKSWPEWKFRHSWSGNWVPKKSNFMEQKPPRLLFLNKSNSALPKPNPFHYFDPCTNWSMWPTAKLLALAPETKGFSRGHLLFDWLGKLWVKGLFDGHHYLEIEGINPNQAKLNHVENFSGIPSKMILNKIGDQTMENFVKMNMALKWKAEGWLVDVGIGALHTLYSGSRSHRLRTTGLIKGNHFQFSISRPIAISHC